MRFSFRRSVAVIAFFFSSGVSMQAFALNDVHPMFEKPLIAGASVSGNYGAASPGKILASRFNPKNPDVRVKAMNGRMGKDTIRTISDADVKDRSSIIAIDFLFWDATGRDLAGSQAALNRLVSLAESENIPIILGEVPELLPGLQPLATPLNAAIKKRCEAYNKCYVMPFQKLLMQVLIDQSLVVEGQRRQNRELIPDGLHLSPLASGYIADLMLRVVSGQSYESGGRITLS